MTNPTEILAAALFECGNAARQNRYKSIDLEYNSKISAATSQSKSTTTSISERSRKALPKLIAEKGTKKAEVELEVDRANQVDLQRAYGVTNQRDLCVRLGVPNHLLVPAMYLPKQPLPLPDRRDLRNQEARTALWWFMVDTWTRDHQEEIWLATNHNELLGATGSLYA